MYYTVILLPQGSDARPCLSDTRQWTETGWSRSSTELFDFNAIAVNVYFIIISVLDIKREQRPEQ